MSRPVTAEMAQIVADACGLKPEDLTILATRHACLVSNIQVPARGIETAMHRLALDGFDLGCIRHAACTGPIPPLIEDELTAFGRINDALYYGREVTLYADPDDEILARLVPQAVSAASPLARRPFAQIYREAGCDFHRIPLQSRTPAVLHVTNLKTGRSYSAGHVDEEVLTRSFYP